MRILQVCHRYPPDLGGVETHVQRISEGLVARGHEVRVICTGKEDRVETLNGIEVQRLKAFAPGDAYYWARKMKRTVEQALEGIDILHAHNFHALPALAAFRARGATPFVFTGHYHGQGHTAVRNALHKGYHFLGRRMFEQADGLIFVSKAEQELASKRFRLASLQAVIPNGFDASEFNREATKKPRTLVTAGRLEPYKRIDRIIAAMAQLPDWNLRIIGTGSEEEALQLQAAKLQNVYFAGKVTREQLAGELCEAHAVVSLSENEAFGISVLEGIAANCYVIASPIPAHAELASKFSHSVRLLATNTPNELVKAALAIPPHAPPRPNLRAYDWSRVARLTEEFYQAVATPSAALDQERPFKVSDVKINRPGAREEGVADDA